MSDFKESISELSIDDLVGSIEQRTAKIAERASEMETYQLEVTMLKEQLSENIQSINSIYFKKDKVEEPDPLEGWTDSGNGHEVDESLPEIPF